MRRIDQVRRELLTPLIILSAMVAMSVLSIYPGLKASKRLISMIICVALIILETALLPYDLKPRTYYRDQSRR